MCPPGWNLTANNTCEPMNIGGNTTAPPMPPMPPMPTNTTSDDDDGEKTDHAEHSLDKEDKHDDKTLTHLGNIDADTAAATQEDTKIKAD